MARIVSGPLLTGNVTSSQTGTPLAGVTVTVSNTVYTDPELSSGATKTLTTNGQGSFVCYAPPGNYTFTCSEPTANPIEPVEVLSGDQGSGNAALVAQLGGTFPARAGGTSTPAASLPFLNVRDFGAVGDGATDDTAAFRLARDAAGVSGVLIASGGTFAVNGLSLNVAGQTWRFSDNAKLLGRAGGTSALVTVSANNVTILDGEIDGNNGVRTANVNNVDWSGTGGVMRRTYVHGSVGRGIRVTGTLDCYDVTSSGNGVVGVTTQDGFVAASGGRLRMFGACLAENNTRHGAWFQSGALDGCRLSGQANSNGGTSSGNAGAKLDCNNGYVDPNFRANDNSGYGLLADTATGWDLPYVTTIDTGKTAANNAGTGVEFWGCTSMRCGTLHSVRPLGYGMAFAKNTSNVGTSYCKVGTIIVDHNGATDQDPGVHFSGGSNHNSVGTIIDHGSTVGVIFGEGVTPLNNDYNDIGTIITEGNSQAGLRIDGGNNNYVGRIRARNVTCTNPTYKGVVSFTTANSTNNTVDRLDVLPDGGTAPPYLAYADASATGNRVNDCIARTGSYATGISLDSNGLNRLVWQRRGRALRSGLAQLTVPGVELSTVTTFGVTANTLYYAPFFAETDLTLASIWLECSTAPAADGHARIGVYEADENFQPKGTPLLDVEQAIPATGGAAVYNILNTATLPAGRYVLAMQFDQVMTLRALVGGSRYAGMVTGLGTTPFVAAMTVANTYGAMPTTPVAWTGATNSSTGIRYMASFRVGTT